MDWIDDLRHHHRTFLGLLDALEGARDGDTVHRGLDDLRRELPGHFALEESAGGFLAEARRRSPHRAAAVDALQAEHRDLVGALGALNGDPERGERLIAFCAALRDHERREAELLAELAYAEEGTLD